VNKRQVEKRAGEQKQVDKSLEDQRQVDKRLAYKSTERHGTRSQAASGQEDKRRRGKHDQT